MEDISNTNTKLPCDILAGINAGVLELKLQQIMPLYFNVQLV